MRTADTDPERLEALALRSAAYVAVGKVDSTSHERPVLDDFDRRSRILIACHKGQVIASMRLIYHAPGDEFEHERFAQLPAALERERTIEISRVCTHPDFRGDDLRRHARQRDRNPR